MPTQRKKPAKIKPVARNTHVRMVKLQAAVDAFAKATNAYILSSGWDNHQLTEYMESRRALVLLATPKAKRGK